MYHSQAWQGDRKTGQRGTARATGEGVRQDRQPGHLQEKAGENRACIRTHQEKSGRRKLLVEGSGRRTRRNEPAIAMLQSETHDHNARGKRADPETEGWSESE